MSSAVCTFQPIRLEVVKEHDTPVKISCIQFCVPRAEDVARTSVTRVTSRDLYTQPLRKPAAGGVLDLHLGPSDKNGQCQTCGQSLASCVGHFGDISLAFPVFHMGYFKATHFILQCVCKTCSRVLLSKERISEFRHKLQSPSTRANPSKKKSILKNILKLCKSQRRCPFCGSPNGTVKKVGMMKLIHDPFSLAKDIEEEKENFFQKFHFVSDTMSDVSPHIQKAVDDLTPLRALEILSRIPPEDVMILGMDPTYNRPENLLLTNFPVPPACIRPSVCSDPTVGSNEDDLTMKLSEIVHINCILQQAMENGGNSSLIMDDWELLQLECARYINADLPGLPPSATSGKTIRGLCQRLKGKQGRFRGNLSGKRVDFSSRTVISPDPNLSIEQVGVPVYVAKQLTYPERVTKHNIKQLSEAVLNGPDIHPGANFVELKDGTKRFLRYGDRKKIAQELSPGLVVERHLRDDDIVLFNRQPSLHRVSIMCHRVKVFPCRTFRLNECVCTPYNADFDGDEMNLHVPQTEEARAEAATLMCVQENLVTPRNGEPLIAATQDFLSACYKFTCKDVFLDKAEFSRIILLSGVQSVGYHLKLPNPAIVKPFEMWTGKQAISFILRMCSGFQTMTAYIHEKQWSHPSGYENFFLAPHLCKNDGYVYVRNGELLCGQLGKASLGSGSKRSLFYLLSREGGNPAAANAMSMIARFASRWFSDFGFSLGIDDVTPSLTLQNRKDELLRAGYKDCDDLIEAFQNRTLEARPGCTMEQTLEVSINAVLSKIREDAGKVCIAAIDPKVNSAMAMALCGSKGSNINISQMISCVGQQTVNGCRVPDGFLGRALPHFASGMSARTPWAKGFVKNSFFSGMTATEFFFHTMAGREGLVDTAVKTAETGYMQRRLMKALEDLSVNYDNTVRYSDGTVVQFLYGDDGLDPSVVEGASGGSCPLNLEQLMEDSKAEGTIKSKGEPRLSPDELIHYAESLTVHSFGAVESNQSYLKILDDVKNFLISTAKKHEMELERVSSSFSDGPMLRDTIDAAFGLRKSQLDAFVRRICYKLQRFKIEPGTAVGAIGAQSIGEPGTQMTLKTFHFAGVASMNITLGVPRIKEIINASPVINTPVITAELVSPNDITIARIVKGRVERTTLGEICNFIKEVYRRNQVYISLQLDKELISKLQLDVDINSVRNAVVNSSKLRLKEKDVTVVGDNRLHIFVPSKASGDLYFQMNSLKRQLPHVVVQGTSTIKRAVIHQKDDKSYQLLVEGSDLLSVMTTAGIEGTRTTSNHVIIVEKVLGIEAARKTVASEIQYTMASHGMSIDTRHVALLADVMSFRGEILGITRFGIGKMKTSAIMLASFEKTVDHLFDAALYKTQDNVVGVSECVIMGMPVPLGTGLFGLLRNDRNSVAIPPPRKETILQKRNIYRRLGL
ncbi:hypothetical protein GpartN1_g565.t1 [Galdieria partita]|uniref:DNA-directed RNA polymerase subunit n=1 Tax=Galdieria partita TaxID=83374 RepID=A0A9C7PQX2_9RHOD|nr:hypothetical protein GpartN1_g565.t1 [Galdieria partita]